jgi:hypothetical protein
MPVYSTQSCLQTAHPQAETLAARPCPVTRVGENQSVFVKSLDIV